jgi:hypothetical protein
MEKKSNKQLQEENIALRAICRDLHWMARRYATGRRSTAPSTLNDHVRKLLELEVSLNPTADGKIWAEDGMGREFDKLTDEMLDPSSPGATGKYIPLPIGTKLDFALREIATDAADLLRKWHAMKDENEQLKAKLVDLTKDKFV